MKIFYQKRKGFTLIELLVVIAIIGILATIVLVSLNTARQKARDARRIGDIRQLALAVEMYYDDSSTGYPGTFVGTTCADWDALSDALDGTTNGIVYMSSIPTDPGQNTYAYSVCSGNESYVLVAELEGNVPDDIDVDTCGCTCSGQFYCVQP